MARGSFPKGMRISRIQGWKCALALSVFLLPGCALDTVPYLFRLAAGQAELLSKRRPIEEVLRDPDSRLSPEFKERLSQVAEVREFARTIGLTPGGAYTQYAPVEVKVFVLTAAERTRLRRHEWRWPVVGSLPYKGFFSKEDAHREAEKLHGRRLDTHVRVVSAYSTLGWFDDPVVPGMLKGSLGSFVSLLLHESVHDTFFRKGHAAFNEQAAVLVEREGALRFLRKKLGKDSAEVRRYREALEEGERFLRVLDGLHADLARLYAGRVSDEEKLSRRKEVFGRYLSTHPGLGERLREEREATGLPVDLNNAYVLSYQLYFENRDQMNRVFGRIGRDLPRMVCLLKRAAEVEGDPFEALERLAEDEARALPRASRGDGPQVHLDEHVLAQELGDERRARDGDVGKELLPDGVQLGVVLPVFEDDHHLDGVPPTEPGGLQRDLQIREGLARLRPEVFGQGAGRERPREVREGARPRDRHEVPRPDAPDERPDGLTQPGRGDDLFLDHGKDLLVEDGRRGRLLPARPVPPSK